MDDITKLLNDLVKYIERNYEGMVTIGNNYLVLKTNEEVFIITVEKDSLENWE